jgi:hypothetical protein
MMSLGKAREEERSNTSAFQGIVPVGSLPQDDKKKTKSTQPVI